MKAKAKPVSETYNFARQIRGSWGNISPVTKIIPNKKVYSRKNKRFTEE